MIKNSDNKIVILYFISFYHIIFFIQILKLTIFILLSKRYFSLGIGDWGFGPIPNTQNPKPKTPNPKKKIKKKKKKKKKN